VKLLGLLRRGLGWRGVVIRLSRRTRSVRRRLSVSDWKWRAMAVERQCLTVGDEGRSVAVESEGMGIMGTIWGRSFGQSMESCGCGDVARITHSWPEAR
jgi:hypothetical protein